MTKHSVRSSFTWLDYPEKEHRAMLAVVDLFREDDARGAIGRAAVHDALAYGARLN